MSNYEEALTAIVLELKRIGDKIDDLAANSKESSKFYRNKNEEEGYE